MIIGIGGLACIVSGYISEKVGTKRTACIALLLSCGCCIVSPLFFLVGPGYVFIGFLLFWGMVVIADSPLFSTLVAQKTEAESKGTALTIVNCIGFSITIVSIQLLNVLRDIVNPNYMYIALAFGPMLGLFALYQSKQKGSA
jgi:MFS family permease